MTTRRAILGALLLATLGWSAWLVFGADGADDSGVVQAVAHREASVTSAPGPDTGPATEHSRATAAERRQAIAVASLAPREAGAAGHASAALETRPAPPAHPRNLFAEYNYEAPKPKVVPVIEKPHAPPLPFAYSGRLIIDGSTTYLLLRGETPVNLIVGAEAGEFKLVDADTQRLIFLHGPTGERVALSIAKAP